MRLYTDQTSNPLTSLSKMQASRQNAGFATQRRPTVEQSRALETLAHAVEHLIDDGLISGETIDLNVTEAVHLLSQASRSAYLSCSEAPGSATDRRASTTHVRWKWMPAPPFMVPLFRDAATESGNCREA